MLVWDATAKYPTGLTEGNVYQFGNFDECLSIDRPFTAQYCLARIEYTIVQNTPIKDPFSLEYDPYESVYKKLYVSKMIYKYYFTFVKNTESHHAHVFVSMYV